MKISFVIPCYRSEKTIEGVVSEIKSVVSQRPEVEYEIIMVSDHSPDDVYSVIERLCREDPVHLKGLKLAKNFGQPAAQMAGFSRTTGDIVFSVDDDGQAPVDAIYDVVDCLLNNDNDIVYGVYQHKKHSLFRNFGSWVNHLMAVVLIGIPHGLHPTSFFAIRRFVASEVLHYDGPFPYISGLVFRVTRNFGTVVVQHRVRKDGESGYTFTKLIKLWVNGFTAFSVKPLRLATILGLLCAVAGFSFGFWIALRKLLLNPNAPVGYSSIMSVVLFIGGVLMLILGLIGEYIGRIYISINRSPQFVISQETSRMDK